MALTMHEKQAVTKELARRFSRAGRKEKQAIIDQVVGIAGYNRSYTTWLLRTYARKVVLPSLNQPELVVVAARSGQTRRRARPRIYDEPVLAALKRVWQIMDCICGKRLAPFLPELVPILERHEELVLDEDTRSKLVTISAASIDRLLAEERRRRRLLDRARARPDTALLRQIPIQTHVDALVNRPGSVEVDLVSHDGGLGAGEYCQTLDVTDRYSGWTETEAVRNKAHLWVFAAMKAIRQRLPFGLWAIHSDNGSEFINHALYDYCQAERLEFTRSRPYEKNDNCHVEQKNYTVVRRAVGYFRYETREQLLLLNRLYRLLRPYTNFFQPTVKLLSKTRRGSTVSKRYEPARTPHQRLLGWEELPEFDRGRLAEEYRSLNPAALKRECERLQRRLLKLVESQVASAPAVWTGQ